MIGAGRGLTLQMHAHTMLSNHTSDKCTNGIDSGAARQHPLHLHLRLRRRTT